MNRPIGKLMRRRTLLYRAGLLSAGVLAASLSACSQPAASPTAAPAPPTAVPAKPTAVPAKPTAAAAAKPAEKPAEKPAATQAPPKPQTLQKAKIAVITGVAEYAFAMAGRQFYNEEGIDPEFVEIVDGTTMIKALVSAEIDHAMLGASALYISQSQGAALKQIGSTFPGLNFVLYAKPGITSLKDLEGKSVGAAGPGSFLSVVTQALLLQKGIDLNKVNFVNIGSSPAVFQAVETGKVDAGPSSVDFLPRAEANKNPIVIADFAKELPLYLRVGSATSDKLIADKPAFLQGIVNGIARSSRFTLDNKAAFVQYGVEKMGKEKAAMEFLHEYDYKNRIVAPDHELDPKWVEYTQKLNVDSAAQKEILPFDKVATLDFQKKLVEKYGKYVWK